MKIEICVHKVHRMKTFRSFRSLNCNFFAKIIQVLLDINVEKWLFGVPSIQKYGFSNMGHRSGPNRKSEVAENLMFSMSNQSQASATSIAIIYYGTLSITIVKG